MESLFVGTFILIISGFISAIFTPRYKIPILTILTGLASILTAKPALQCIWAEKTLKTSFNFNELFGTVNFVIDPLSAFFIVIISIMGFISVIYADGYLKPYIEKGKSINSHIIFLPLLIASMLAVVSCQNAFLFLICWEIMSLSSFFLVIFENEKKEVLKAGIHYLVFMHISVIFIIIAFAMLALKSGSFDFTGFANCLQDKHFANLIFVLLFIGFGTKAGFVPFHSWLPEAHPAAPSHVSALMSGVMIKTGIYGILRTLSLIGTPSKSITFAVLIISLTSALYCVLYAICQSDIKKMLAYSSIENIGIIGLGISIGMLGLSYNNSIVAILGFAGGILHILNHSIFKELLFFAAGSVYNKTHTRNVELLGGLYKVMPKTALLFLIGAIAICGLPPFNGFVSEILIYFGMFKGLTIHNFFSVVMLLFAIAGLALVGTMAILCFSRIFSIGFLGLPRSEKVTSVKSEVPYSMIFPMSLLSFAILLIGLCPQYLFKFVLHTVGFFTDVTGINLAEPICLMRTISIFALGFMVIIALLILLKLKLSKGKITLHETWGCGYNKANNHMQYTASSYASPFLSMLTPLFKKVFDIEKPRKLFPKSAHFNLHVEDIEDAYVIEPILKSDEWFLSKFEGIQSGNIQSYIKYGLIFLLIIIIGSLFYRG